MSDSISNNTPAKLSSIEASRRFDITNDYVTLLCRQGKVKGELLGRAWYVDEESLRRFLEEMRLKKETRNQQLSNSYQSGYVFRQAVPPAAAPIPPHLRTAEHAALKFALPILLAIALLSPQITGVARVHLPVPTNSLTSLTAATQNGFGVAAAWDAWTGYLAGILYPTQPVTADVSASSVDQPQAQAVVQTSSTTAPGYAQGPGTFAPTEKYPMPSNLASQPTADYVTRDELTQQLQRLSDSIQNVFASQESLSNSTLYTSLWRAISLSQRVDNLPSTVTVGSAPVATTQTLGNYLPLTGGTLTGAISDSDTATSTFAGGLTAATASSTDLISTTANIASLVLSGVTGSTQCLHVDSSGTVSGTGSDCGGGGSAPYPFSLAGNATSTLTQFNGGLTAFASSTIGDGTQTGGLTVSGGATTTGIAYFGSKVGIGTKSPGGELEVVAQSAGDGFRVSATGTNSPQFSLYNGSTQQGAYGLALASANYSNFSGAGDVIVRSTGASNGNLIISNQNSNGNILFGTFKSGGFSNDTESMRLTTAGKLGIGTTSPYAALSVVGSTGVVAGKYTATSTTDVSSFQQLLVNASTTLQNLTALNATTTLFANTGTASTTNLIVSSAGGTAGCATFDTIGTISNTGVACGSGSGTFPFTSTANFGVVTNSTSTPIWFQNGLQASSTAYLSNISTIGVIDFATTSPNASSTLISFNGQSFLYASSTDKNTALGIGVLANINHSTLPSTYGDSNVAIGYQAGASIGFGWQNVAIGDNALTGRTTSSAYFPSYNVAIGHQSLYSVTTGAGNTCIGVATCDFVTTGSNNFALGYNALNGNIGSGSGNSAIGTFALDALTGKSYNIGIGYQVGANTNANYDLLIGNNVDAGKLTTDGQLNIGNFFFGTGLQNASYSGAIATSTFGIGTTSPFARFSIAANNGDTNTALFAISSSTQSATSTLFIITNTGNVGVGTSTPYAQLSVFTGEDYASRAPSTLFAIASSSAGTATSTFVSVNSSGLLSVGNNGSNLFTVDATTGSTTVANLSLGNLNFDTDAGIVNLTDTPVDSNAANGVQQAQVLNIGGNPVLTVSGIANGSGGVGGLGVSVGTSTNPYSVLQVWGSDAASSTSAFAVVNNSSTTVFAVFDGGNAQLSGTLTQSSDRRLKTDISSLNASTTLALIAELNPVTFNWIDSNRGTGPQVGLIAQEVQQIFPQLVSTTTPTGLTPDGTLGVNYIGFVAPIIESIKALVQKVNDFADQFTTHKLCLSDDSGTTCVTKAQLDRLLAGAGSSSTSNSDATSAPDNPQASSTPSSPQLSVNGANPATITVGTTYADLGATITGPAGDTNLDITASLDGANSTPVSDIHLDTSTPGTHTITYSATDQNGLTGTAQRTVDIIAITLPAVTGTDSSASSTTK